MTTATKMPKRFLRLSSFLVLLAFPASAQDVYIVEKIIDGDTIKLENDEIVRLIGIDTPESKYNQKLYRDARRAGVKPYDMLARGKRAALFTSNLVRRKRIVLDYDADRKDHYGRTLAYVYLEDGTFVNAEIIKNCQAVPMTISPNVKYRELFESLYQNCKKR